MRVEAKIDVFASFAVGMKAYDAPAKCKCRVSGTLSVLEADMRDAGNLSGEIRNFGTILNLCGTIDGASECSPVRSCPSKVDGPPALLSQRAALPKGPRRRSRRIGSTL